MKIKKTKQGKDYIHTGMPELDETNKNIADNGGSILEQYEFEDTCKHGDDFNDCFICS